MGCMRRKDRPDRNPIKGQTALIRNNRPDQSLYRFGRDQSTGHSATHSAHLCDPADCHHPPDLGHVRLGPGHSKRCGAHLHRTQGQI